jgi:hypothetical protein
MFDDIIIEKKKVIKEETVKGFDDDDFADIIGEQLDDIFGEPKVENGNLRNVWFPKKSVYRENRYNGNKKNKRRKKS